MDWIGLAQDKDTRGLLRIRQWTFGFHKKWGISWLAKEVLASQGISCMDLIFVRASGPHFPVGADRQIGRTRA